MKKEEAPLHIGRASDLSGSDRVLYRALEMMPAAIAWGTLLLIITLSIYAPAWAAYIIIGFSFYWLLKTAYLSIHLRYNWKRLKYHLNVNWGERILHLKHEHLWNLVILPFATESYEVIERNIEALIGTHGDKKKLIVVLAAEERMGESALAIAKKAQEKYAHHFGHFLITVHPADIPGEIIGKGSNIAYAAEEARTKILDEHAIAYEDVIVSAFDIDTVVYPDYFNCLSWHFLTVDDPHKTSFQPVPLYNNNIWDAPALARVVAVSGTFWQMIQQERPEKLATFSSHSMSFKGLHEGGYWQRNMVSEDSRIYWNLFFAHNGDYKVMPIAYPVSLDTNFAPTFWKTMVNVYKQQRRWTWGVENVPYVIFQSMKRKAIPLKERLRIIAYKVEGFWSLSTHPLILFLLGWLPLVLGTPEFHVTVLSYNLTAVARTMLTLAMFGLVISAIISLSLLPPRPQHHGKEKFVFLVLQWILVPFTMIVFSAIPGLEAQTRLAFGRYLGFWVTPKYAEKSSSGQNVQNMPMGAAS